jgi:putative oxidoreductase
MKTLMTAGRILFALPFLVMGINHFIMIDVFTGMLSSFIPGGGYTVLLTGAFLIFAAVCLIINKWVPVMCYLLAGLLFLFILTIHIPGFFAPDITREHLVEVHLMNLLKDLGLMGGALVIGVFSSPEGIKAT